MQDTQFLKELDDFMLEVNKECEEFGREITAEMLSDLTDQNALDTGRCTASWVASVGTPVYHDAKDITTANTMTRDEAKARSMATLSNLAAYKLGQPIFLSNGTDYISGIEDGSNSAKSVAFVTLTSVKFSPVVDSEII